MARHAVPIVYHSSMSPEEDAELARLMAAHDKAKDWEQETRYALFAFLQDKMITGPRGIQAELIKKTGKSKQHLGDIKAGRWSRDESKNP